jgi:hypothetical protein
MCCSAFIVFLEMCAVFLSNNCSYFCGRFQIVWFLALCGLVHRWILTFQKTNLTLKDTEKLYFRNHHLFLLLVSFTVIISGVQALVILVFAAT